MKQNNNIEEEASLFLRKSMVRYGEEVNENRAFPRIEDGLKPVQRLLLWSCKDLNSSSRFVKSANITGHTIAKYSPHGDEAAYQALVGLVNEKYPLIEGQGNFGSNTLIPAAARYTEARLHEFVRKISLDLPDLSAVPYETNYDETRDQPVYLPMAIPYILLNGVSGIGVGIATRIPAFNLEEVINACIAFLSTKDKTKASKKIIAPDMGRCKILSSKKEVSDLVQSGEGTIEYQCEHSISSTSGKNTLTVTGYPPEYSVSGFLRKCGSLKDEGKINAARNETCEENGDKITVEYQGEEATETLLKLLKIKVPYKMNVLFEQPNGKVIRQVNVGDVIEAWAKVRSETVVRMFEEKEKLLKRSLFIEEAKSKAVINLKALFKAVSSEGDLRTAIVKELKVTQEEAEIIADMKIDALKRASYDEVQKRIAQLKIQIINVAGIKAEPDSYLIAELKEILAWTKKKYPTFLERQTKLPEV